MDANKVKDEINEMLHDLGKCSSNFDKRKELAKKFKNAIQKSFMNGVYDGANKDKPDGYTLYERHIGEVHQKGIYISPEEYYFIKQTRRILKLVYTFGTEIDEYFDMKEVD